VGLDAEQPGGPLSALAKLTDGDARDRLLSEATAAFLATLEVRTRAADPAGWAQSQNNLGAALTAQAELAENAERSSLLEQAMTCLRAALEFATERDMPRYYRAAQDNLDDAERLLAVGRGES
jgi:hypothetical protein